MAFVCLYRCILRKPKTLNLILFSAAFGLLPGRVTYVLDKKGVCVKVYDELANAASHVDVAKEALSKI